MGQLAAAIHTMFTAQRAYDEARMRHAPSEELIALADAMKMAIIAHGVAMQATPRAQWQVEADAALADGSTVSSSSLHTYPHRKDED